LKDYGTSRRPNLEGVERPANWQKRTLKVMEQVKKEFGFPDAHIAHQLSWDAMEEKVVKLVREGDERGLQKFVEEFERRCNSLLEDERVKRNPELQQHLRQVLAEQKQDIQEKLLNVLEAMPKRCRCTCRGRRIAA